MKNTMRMGWTAAAALVVVACGGGAKTAPAPESPPVATTPPPAPETPPPAPTPPPPPPKTDGEQKLADRFQECLKAINTHEEAAIAGCYAENAESGVSDSPEKISGGANIAANWKQTFTAFPDFAMRSVMVFVNGNKVAGVVHASGMHGGPFMGNKATNRGIGLYGMRLTEWTEDKMQQDTHIFDPSAILSQIGKMKGPARKVGNPPNGEPKVVLATDSKQESDNVAVVKAFCDGYNKHDVATISATLADDVNWSDQTSPSDISGKANVEKELAAILKAFPDLNANCDAWGAGDYVVSWTAWTATNKGAWKDIGIPKPTNKQVSAHDGEVFEVSNGKIKNYWRFSNGMALGMQLGLVKPPKAPKAPKPTKAK